MLISSFTKSRHLPTSSVAHVDDFAVFHRQAILVDERVTFHQFLFIQISQSINFGRNQRNHLLAEDQLLVVEKQDDVTCPARRRYFEQIALTHQTRVGRRYVAALLPTNLHYSNFIQAVPSSGGFKCPFTCQCSTPRCQLIRCCCISARRLLSLTR